MTTTTATFRDYAFDDLAGGAFSIDTSGQFAVISAATNHPEFAVVVEIDRQQAREIGTSLLQWAGNPTLHAYDDWCATGGVEVNVIDGEIEITVARSGEISGYEPTTEQAIDLGQRLIVWAGVAVETADV